MSTLYMLDTDTLSYFLRDEGRVAERLLRHPVTSLCVSAISVAELMFGAVHRRAPATQRSVETFIRTIPVAPFDAACAMTFGRVAADLAKRGAQIGQMDLLIATHALTLDATVVTNNVKDFSRVRGLRLENWL